MSFGGPDMPNEDELEDALLQAAACPTDQPNPAQPGFRITEITAFTKIGPDDEEGVCAFLGPDGMWMPMIAADPHRVDDLRAIAHTLFAGEEISERRFVPAGEPSWFEVEYKREHGWGVEGSDLDAEGNLK